MAKDTAELYHTTQPIETSTAELYEHEFYELHCPRCEKSRIEKPTQQKIVRRTRGPQELYVSKCWHYGDAANPSATPNPTPIKASREPSGEGGARCFLSKVCVGEQLYYSSIADASLVNLILVGDAHPTEVTPARLLYSWLILHELGIKIEGRIFS